MEAKDKIKEMLLSDDSEMIYLGIILSRTQLTERQRIDVYYEIQIEKPNQYIRLHNGKIKKSKNSLVVSCDKNYR